MHVNSHSSPAIAQQIFVCYLGRSATHLTHVFSRWIFGLPNAQLLQTGAFTGFTLTHTRYQSFLRLLQGFHRKHIILRRNGAFLAKQAQAITAIIEQSGGLGHVLGNNADIRKKTEHKRLRLANGVRRP